MWGPTVSAQSVADSFGCKIKLETRGSGLPVKKSECFAKPEDQDGVISSELRKKSHGIPDPGIRLLRAKPRREEIHFFPSGR